jgi:hypothetical protein
MPVASRDQGLFSVGQEDSSAALGGEDLGRQ